MSLQSPSGEALLERGICAGFSYYDGTSVSEWQSWAAAKGRLTYRRTKCYCLNMTELEGFAAYVECVFGIVL